MNGKNSQRRGKQTENLRFDGHKSGSQFVIVGRNVEIEEDDNYDDDVEIRDREVMQNANVKCHRHTFTLWPRCDVAKS